MKRTIWRRGLILAAAGLAAATFLTPATASAGTTSPADYWTPDAMRSAVPMEQLIQGPATKATPAPVAKGAPTEIAPLGAAPGAVPMAFPNNGSGWTGGGAVVKTTGRVFFTFQGRRASCSGDAVTSTNGSVVMTAGHCVKYQGSWHTNWIFVPAYNNGNAPYGEWTAASTRTTPQWQASEDINYDVGAAVVNQRGGQRLTDVVGSQGIAFNQAYNQPMYTFGYPAAAPYDGSRLIYCSGNTFRDFLLSNDHGMSCNMTGGSSGGPWFLRFNEAAGTGVQASVNSFGYTFLPGYMFGPYFGADAQTLYQQAQAA